MSTIHATPNVMPKVARPLTARPVGSTPVNTVTVTPEVLPEITQPVYYGRKKKNFSQDTRPRYQFRNLAFGHIDDLWCVQGTYEDRFGTMTGVLEWCVGMDDAEEMYRKMEQDDRFSNLSFRDDSEEMSSIEAQDHLFAGISFDTYE